MHSGTWSSNRTQCSSCRPTRHPHEHVLPRLGGWWGNAPESRFEMRDAYEPRPDAAGWQVTNPPILALAPLKASLDLFDRAGMLALRARSERLTTYLEAQLDARRIGRIITPRDPAARRRCVRKT